MSTYNYKLKLHSIDKTTTVSIDFTPYTNIMSQWSTTINGWSSANSSASVSVDAERKLFNSSTLNFKLLNANEGTIYKDVACSENTYYMISCYVRNNGVLTTGLRVGSANDWSSNYFTNRLIVKVNSGSATSLRVNLDMFYKSDSLANAWIGGFFMVPITESEYELPIEELSKRYVYVLNSKSSPSMKDVLAHKYYGSPFQYFLTMDGVRIANYNYPLQEYGVTSDTLLESHINELPVQIFYTFIDSVALMAMLEGDITRVSHTYPKMPNNDVDLRIFPRVQYFMGFEVSSARADGKPLANNVNVSINSYVPITKVTNSMQDSMLSTIITSLMGDLGFSAIRGSDFFREPEQLYVRQTQYVKDIQLSKKVKA